MRKEQGFSMIALIFLICITLNVFMNQSVIADAQMAQDEYYTQLQQEQESLDNLENKLYEQMKNVNSN